MNNLPQIPNAEFEIMNVIWKDTPISTHDIVERLSYNKVWKPKTIQTMLFRLEKGVITHDKDSQVVVSYMDQNELSDEDINQLQAILDKKRKN